MTYNKQIRELDALIEKLGKDFKLFEFMDTWKFKYDGPMGMTRTEEVRETITLENVYNQFINKTGVFYELYKITDNFREFVHIISDKYYEPVQKRNLTYNDSYEKFHEEWNKLHPEILYETYEKQEDEKAGRRLSEMMAIYAESYYKIRNIFA